MNRLELNGKRHPTDAMRQFSLNIQKFEEDKLEGRETGSGTGDPNVSWSLSYILVLLTKNDIIFESGLLV
jgi:hypothetical protein